MDLLGAALFTVLVLCLLAGVLVAFIVLTEGRYFGKALVRWLYDRLAGAFATVNDAARWETFLRAVPIASDQWVLDVGTAAGHLPLVIAGRQGFRGLTVGLDWSLPLIRRAQQQTREWELAVHAAFLVADARDPLPFAPAAFDVVVCLGVLDALPQPDERLADLTRLVRPGGRIALSLSRRMRLGDHDEAWFRQQLASVGFCTIKRRTWSHMYDLLVAWR